MSQANRQPGRFSTHPESPLDLAREPRTDPWVRSPGAGNLRASGAAFC